MDMSPARALAAAIHPQHAGPAVLRAAAERLDALAPLAREHRVSGLLARALERSGVMQRLASDAWLRLRRDLLDAQHERAALEQVFREAADALDAAGIRFVALKGLALGALAYAEPSLRPISDVDLLVAPAQLDAAVEALAARGFGRPSEADRAFWREAYYNIPLAAPGGHGSVEIHWSIAQRGRHAPDVAGILERARDLPLAGRAARIPGEADLVLHQALHLAYHYFQPKLIWIHDLALLFGSARDTDEVVERARAWGMTVPLALAVAHAEKVFPGCVAPALARLGETTPRARWILRAAGSDDALALVRGWNRRPLQLALGLAMLDRPGQLLRTAGSWIARALRYGDREGHRRLGHGDPGAGG
ncbi:MAG: nucleotidyltransferase family protein [Acidobacteria bacterium]|nr:nucleotidyltransferase family protein [Acidobacteriota bacterium]